MSEAADVAEAPAGGGHSVRTGIAGSPGARAGGRGKEPPPPRGSRGCGEGGPGRARAWEGLGEPPARCRPPERSCRHLDPGTC